MKNEIRAIVAFPSLPTDWQPMEHWRDSMTPEAFMEFRDVVASETRHSLPHPFDANSELVERRGCSTETLRRAVIEAGYVQLGLSAAFVSTVKVRNT